MNSTKKIYEIIKTWPGMEPRVQCVDLPSGGQHNDQFKFFHGHTKLATLASDTFWMIEKKFSAVSYFQWVLTTTRRNDQVAQQWTDKPKMIETDPTGGNILLPTLCVCEHTMCNTHFSSVVNWMTIRQ